MIEIDDREFKEWHAYIKRQRDHFEAVLGDIACGSVPTIPGMASEYRKLTREEMSTMAKDVLLKFQ